MSTTLQKPTQPLHPSVIPKLDPEYIDFHQKYILHSPPQQEWDPVQTRGPELMTIGRKTPLEVGKIEEFKLQNAQTMRAYTPLGEPPMSGWPGLIYFHGGGWALGGLNSEQSIITNLCIGAKCVVITVDYRLAPENKFPAAVEDAVEALQWILTDGKVLLNIDTSKIAAGGFSAGGNLAVVIALKSAEASFDPPLPAPMALQLLFAPTIDQTASDGPGGRWESNKHAPFLWPEHMEWFKSMYFRSEEDWLKWEASPLLAPEELLKKAPKAWIGAGEMDILCNESEAYAEKLIKCGVEAECVIYKGGTHLNFMLDNVMKSGATGISDAVTALAKAFGTSEEAS